MSSDARRKNRKAGLKAGHRREAGRTPRNEVRIKRDRTRDAE